MMRNTVRISESNEASGQRQGPTACVVGGGAIGSLLAAHLAQVVPVALLTRREEHAHDVREQGLRVSGLHEFTAQVNATSKPEELPDFEIGFLATKATEIEAAARSLEGRFPQATIVTIQNGVGTEDLVRAHGDWPIVAGTTLMGGTRLSNVHVEYELDAPTWLGPHEETTHDRVEEVAALITRSGLNAQPFTDIRPPRWSKLIFNGAVGTVSAVTGIPHSRPFADEKGLGALIRDLIDEGRCVAAAAGIELYEDPWALNVRAVGDGSFSHAPSIMLDVEARKPTEADFNIGAIVRDADRLGVPVPLSAALYRLLKAKEASFG